jgi:hypothetical protein
MNDPQFVEASRGFASRILRDGGKSTGSRIAFAFRQATGRGPASDEAKVLEDVLKKELSDYRKDKESAAKLLNVGAFKPEGGFDPAELAAWTTVASMILNLDETVTKG